MCLFSSCRCSSQLPPLLLQPQLPHAEPEQASAATPPQQPRPHHQGECHLWYLRRKLHASLQLQCSTGRNMSFGQPATAGYVFRGVWNHMIPKRVDAVGHWSSALHLAFVHLRRFIIFPALQNTNNQLFCSVKNAERERRGLFGVETNATLPADWKHHEPRKDSGPSRWLSTAWFT